MNIKKKQSIRNKVSGLTIITALVSVAVIGLTAIGGIWYLRKCSVTVYSDLSAMVFMDSLDTFLNTATNDAEKLIRKRAELADAKFYAWKNTVEALARSAEDIIQNPGCYNPRPVAAEGLVRIQYAENASLSDIEGKAALAGNLRSVLTGITDHVDNVTAAYIGSELGYFIIADDGLGERLPYFDPRERPWYKAAKEAGGTIWTEVYEDAYGRGLIITCAVPFYDDESNIAGVVGIDALLTDLSFLINEGKSWQTETSFILDGQKETVVSGEAPSGAPWNDIWEFLSAGDDEYIAKIAGDISAGLTGVDSVYFTRTTDGMFSMYVIAYTALESLPWRIVTLIDADEIYEPAGTMMGNINEMTETSLENINTVIFTLIGAFAAILILSVLLIGYISRRFARSLTNPIVKLGESVHIIAQGDLDHHIDIHTGDEIEDLGLSVNKMALDLREYIANLTAVTAEKERISAELNIATQIQADMLPSIFPAFPEREEFDIYATMQPAREVGGDFYDFFMIDDDHLGIVMADVSGKSVPAALFMVIAKTLINNRARNKEQPQDVFINVNSQLCEGNETAMFVTAWLGVLEISSGRMTYVNAGHNPPLFKKAGGSYEYLKTRKGFVLAGLNGFKYKQLDMQLGKGDTLYLYTDGVTEANNAADELYGEERLQNTLNRLSGLPPAELLPRVKADIDLFADGAPQFDDITMLAIQIK